MLLRNLLLLASTRSSQVSALAIGGRPGVLIKNYERGEPLQDIVTWDESSLFVRGERILFYSGEVHPFRLPVPSLYLDIFQKIKSLGYNGVSFYVNWALVEGKPGSFSAEGVFDLEPFFEAAKTAGIYLLARPGPYINAEVSGGGFPGWLQRNPASFRTRDPRWLAATDNYVKHITEIIAKAQITNGGPVILVQPENEYTQGDDPNFPDPVYWAALEKQLRDAGIIVPFISNDSHSEGYFAPGSGNVTVDIYGHDSYPLGFDCANPTTWPDNSLPTNFRRLHEQQSPTTPYSIVEFQGGSFDPWGGLGFEKCAQLLNSEFERVFYNDMFSFGVTIFNIYMTYGGTNWGNLGHPGGYTSYDYGSVITEERLVTREKYSQAKLEANFLRVSPAYLTAIPQDNLNANGSYTNSDAIAVTALFGNTTKFYVARHSAYNSLESTQYTLTLPTSKGNLTVPQLGGQLSLNGRDSKIHVSDYDLGGINLLYSTAEIFTWKKYGDKTVLIVYGGPNEQHELAVSHGGDAKLVEGQDVKIEQKNGTTVLNFATSSARRIVDFSFEGLQVFILDRNSAYNYWTIDLPSDATTDNFTNPTSEQAALIVKSDYLLRTAHIAGGCVHLTGDLNCTSEVEVIGAPAGTDDITFNGKSLQVKSSAPSHGGSSSGFLAATATYEEPTLKIPDLSTIQWKSINSLPEIQSSYDDSAWTACSNPTTPNNFRNLTTPTSLYASDYGYHTGSLLYRGHFRSTSSEKAFTISTQGGSAFGHSIWLDSTFLGSFAGADVYDNTNASYPLATALTSGTKHVITVLIDHMGLDESGAADIRSGQKSPRGILNYNLDDTPIDWKMTGNLGGEDFRDASRGPLNEGGMFAERQGYHLPGAPIESWNVSEGGPNAGFHHAGVQFYATTFDLDMPKGYDIPLSISFTNGTEQSSGSGNAEAYRVQVFVNGWQFGKYVHNIGPQDVFPVPEGIWDYHGSNYLALTLWSLDGAGAKTTDLKLVAGPIIQTGYGDVKPSPGAKWEKREGAY